MPINNFIIATKPLGAALARRINRDNVAVVDDRYVPNYFHMTADHRLLFGGGETYVPWFPRDIPNFVRKRLTPIYPEFADMPIDYAWGGSISVTLNRFPHIGKLGRNVYFAQGYSGHGVAMSNFAGKIIAEAIGGTAERLDVFAHLPMYPFPGGRFLRWPLLVLGMLYYAMKDRF
jgi:gamma-glutamylputrescine oxidase